MTKLLPPHAFVDVEVDTADSWHDAAIRLLPRDPRKHYRPEVQIEIRETVRGAAPEAFDQLTAAICSRVAMTPFACVVRGVRWDDQHHVLIALNSGLGTLVAGKYQPPRSQIIHELEVKTELDGRQGRMRAAEEFHSDGTNFSDPPRLLTMACERADPGGGGVTRILTADQFRAVVSDRLGAKAVRFFEDTPLPWRVSDPADDERHSNNLDSIQNELGWRHIDPRGEGVVWRPILDGDGVLWRRQIIDHGFALLGQVPSTEIQNRLSQLCGVLSGVSHAFEYRLEAGEFLVSDNLRILHARTALTEGYATSARRMLRCWVRTCAS